MSMGRSKSMRLLQWARWWLVKRAATISLAVLVVVVIVGTALHGWTYISHPLPVPSVLAAFWLTCNGILALTVVGFTLRNMYMYEPVLNSAQIAIGRGIVWVGAGASLSYLSHLATDADHGYVTLGTPGITLGFLALIYGAQGSRGVPRGRSR